MRKTRKTFAWRIFREHCLNRLENKLIKIIIQKKKNNLLPSRINIPKVRRTIERPFAQTIKYRRVTIYVVGNENPLVRFWKKILTFEIVLFNFYELNQLVHLVYNQYINRNSLDLPNEKYSYINVSHKLNNSFSCLFFFHRNISNHRRSHRGKHHVDRIFSVEYRVQLAANKQSDRNRLDNTTLKINSFPCSFFRFFNFNWNYYQFHCIWLDNHLSVWLMVLELNSQSRCM